MKKKGVIDMLKNVVLTSKELEVALLISQGLKDYEIANRLKVSRRRVCEIVHSLKNKYNVENRVGIGVTTYLLGLLKEA